MKIVFAMALMVLPVVGAEMEGTAWYDSNGKLVVVDGPSAESAKQPFVPEWRRRELERRERMRTGSSPGLRYSNWDGDSRYPVFGYGGGYSGAYFHPPGWSVCRPGVAIHHGGFGHSFGSIRVPPISIIIR